MVSISKQCFLTTHAFEKEKEYLGSEMTARQRYSASGLVPAHPLEVELMYCDGNITAYLAKEQVIPTGAGGPGVIAVSRKIEPNGIEEEEL